MLDDAKFPVRLSRAAEADREAIAIWYGQISSPLGIDFFDQLEVVLRRISQNPSSGRPFTAEIRVLRISRFPYRVFYRVSAAEASVIAVLHDRRDTTSMGLP
jgi:toxin ParE1/3/4